MPAGSKAPIDAVTRAWIRNPADEAAAAAGCRFDPLVGVYPIFWIERYCKLYQGDGFAGQPLILRGCHQCLEYNLPRAIEFDAWDDDAQAVYVERSQRHLACIAAGHAIDWQFDCTIRMFGWQRWSERWQRWIRRFREATIFVAKKNKKSPTGAAWGMYLLAGDGEPGQQVLVAAKDGAQARKIVGEHAVQMLDQSPDLDRECKLNKSTFRIAHLPSRSWMEPLSSSNERTQKSKEGLNGSVIIDELHVVDRDLVRRINRAGISRSEPLQIEISTAGNDPDSYGKERFDYALQVERGEQENQALFTAIFAAPQDLDDPALDADPLKYGRMANPAMGHTVDPEEFLHDYKSSKRSIGTLLDFKMYRLNIWQRTSNPWIRAGDWAKCRRDYSAEDLAGAVCWAGLDLSRTYDMSALVLVFPWLEPDRGGGPDVFRLLPFFWLPRERAEEIESTVPQLLAWVDAGYLELTPGGAVDYGYIRSRFRELHEKFSIQELVYDPKFANETTQALEEGVIGKDGQVLESGTGVTRVAFGQGDDTMAPPTADFERLIVEGKLQHNGHPVLTWQVGHAHVIRRATSQAKRVVKPSRQSHDPRTIDGIVGAIMALARAEIGEVAGPGVW